MLKALASKLVPDSLWTKIRLCSILRSHKRVAEYCDVLIGRYDNGELEEPHFVPKKTFSKPVIWQYWGQGTTDLPEIVKMCFRSFDRYAGGEYEIVRLDDATIPDYLDLPDYVMEKVRNGIYSRTHFSDLLRLCLLETYGGIWADATILLTGPIPAQIRSAELFLYQRSDDVVDKKYWESSYAYYWGWHPKFKVRSLNSFIVSSGHDLLLKSLLAIVLEQWRNADGMPDYFFFQILFDQIVRTHPDWNCEIVSDTLPHLLQQYTNGYLGNITAEQILQMTPIHKLSLKNNEMAALTDILHD